MKCYHAQDNEKIRPRAVSQTQKAINKSNNLSDFLFGRRKYGDTSRRRQELVKSSFCLGARAPQCKHKQIYAPKCLFDRDVLQFGDRPTNLELKIHIPDTLLNAQPYFYFCACHRMKAERRTFSPHCINGIQTILLSQ